MLSLGRIVVKVKEYQEAKLSCNAVGYPDPSVWWSHDYQIESKYDNQFELTLENVRMEDDGMWACHVSNGCNESSEDQLLSLFQLVVSSTGFSQPCVD